VVAACAKTSFCEQSGWTKVWYDEFTGDTLDNTSWTIDTQGNDSRVRDALGTTDNVYIEKGHLVLRSQKESIGGYSFTSGAVQTRGLRSWSGLTRVCVQAKLPGGQGGGNGIWPAHWLMPDNDKCWPSNGEIDIMEMINGDGVTHGTYHWQVNGSCGDYPHHHPSIGSSTSASSTWATGFHEYAVEYSNQHIAFVFDEHVFKNITTNSKASSGQHAEFFAVPYYLILNTAVGGPWPKPVDASTVFPAYHYIDYVKVSQRTD